eukprot:scaffold2058_cov115-Isochrysis_galbana.AAC.14
MAPETLYVGFSPAAAHSDACDKSGRLGGRGGETHCSAGRIERTSSSCSASRLSGLNPVTRQGARERGRCARGRCWRATRADAGTVSRANTRSDIVACGCGVSSAVKWSRVPRAGIVNRGAMV